MLFRLECALFTLLTLLLIPVIMLVGFMEKWNTRIERLDRQQQEQL